MTSPNKNSKKCSLKRSFFYLVLFFCGTCTFLLVSYYVDYNRVSAEINDNQRLTKEIILELPEIPEQIIPTEKTRFFSPEKGQALLYYAIVNDSVKFFKTQGIEPITGKSVKPITQEIVARYKENRVSNKSVSNKETRSYKVKEVKIIKKKEKPEEKKPKRKSIWNSKIVNSPEEDEISLFVFDSKNRIDPIFNDRLHSEFIKKAYFVTEELIYLDMMNDQIAENLKSANIKYFDQKLKLYTDYLCIGTVSYSFTENEYRNDFLDCTAEVVYFIYDAATGEQMFIEEDKLIGSGQTRETAKREAVQKFVL